VAKSTRLVISIFLLPPETLALQGGEEVSFSNPTFFSFSAILLISASSALFPQAIMMSDSPISPSLAGSSFIILSADFKAHASALNILRLSSTLMAVG